MLVCHIEPVNTWSFQFKFFLFPMPYALGRMSCQSGPSVQWPRPKVRFTCIPPATNLSIIKVSRVNMIIRSVSEFMMFLPFHQCFLSENTSHLWRNLLDMLNHLVLMHRQSLWLVYNVNWHAEIVCYLAQNIKSRKNPDCQKITFHSQVFWIHI